VEKTEVKKETTVFISHPLSQVRVVNGIDQAELSDGTNLASRTTSYSFTLTLD